MSRSSLTTEGCGRNPRHIYWFLCILLILLGNQFFSYRAMSRSIEAIHTQHEENSNSLEERYHWMKSVENRLEELGKPEETGLDWERIH